jgi:hypothetical protein
MLLDYGGDLHLKNAKRVTPLYFATPKMQKLLGVKEKSAWSSHSHSSFRDTGRSHSKF